MKEIWKDIEDYEGLYQVSNLGNVRSLNYNGTHKIKEMAHQLMRKGYLRVHLSKNNKSKRISIHRLVAETFIPNPNNLPQVNHIDGNKQNNCVSNLEWCTNLENQRHAWNNGLRKSKKGYHINSAKSVYQYDLEGNFIKQWDYISDASKELGISLSSIYRNCNNQIKKPKYYIWKYANK